MDTIVRVMRPDEFEAMRELSVAAFGDDAQIRLLLNLLHDSWAWEHDLSFVAEHSGELVGQVLLATRSSTRRAVCSMCWCSARSAFGPICNAPASAGR